MRLFTRVVITSVTVASLIGLVGPMTTLAAGPAAVDLGSAANFAILAKSGISTTGTTAITGYIGVSPIAATGMTGFGLIMDSSNTFSTSSLVTGRAYAADYAVPTPATMTTAISDMETAYTAAAGRTLPTSTELGAGNIGGQTIAPGLYKWSTGVTVPTDVTLSGGASDVWIFQIGQTLTTSSGTRIILSGGAQAANIFWQVAGQTTLGTNSVFNGNILDQTAIVLNTGATLTGRALAQTAVTLDANTVTRAVAVAAPAPTNTNTAVTNTNTAVTTTNTSTAANTNTTVTTNTSSAAAAVTTPALPNTGLAPRAQKNVPWQIPVSLIVLVGVVAFTQRKRIFTNR